MSSEERQRELRQEGHRGAAESEKEDKAARGKHAVGAQQAEDDAQQPRSPDEPEPEAQDDPDRPTPRR